MKSGKAKLVGADQDLRPRYDGIDSTKYDVVLCPVCAYGALASSFTHITPGQTKMIRDNISANAKINFYHDEVYSYKEALERYELALACAVVKRAKASEKAYICLKTGWMLRGYAESLRDMDEPPVPLEELEQRIQIQEDIRAIEHLQADYWDCLDQKDWVGLRACFTDDFVFMNKTTGGRYEGGDGMVETMKGKFTEQVTSSHHGHHHWVEITGEATATLVNAGPEALSVSLPEAGYRDLISGEEIPGTDAAVPPYSVRLLGRG